MILNIPSAHKVTIVRFNIYAIVVIGITPEYSAHWFWPCNQFTHMKRLVFKRTVDGPLTKKTNNFHPDTIS